MKKHLFLLLVFFNVLLVFAQFENTLIPYRLKDKWGFCDINGKIKIQPIFEYVGFYNGEGYAIVKQNGKFGIIDSKSKFTCVPKYKNLVWKRSNYDIYNYFFATDFKGNVFAVDFKGLKIPKKGSADNNSDIMDYLVKIPADETNNDLGNDNKINSLQNNHLAQIYKSHFYFKMNNDTFIYCIDKFERHGILNSTFQEIVPFKFVRIEEYKGLFKVSLNNSSYKDGLYDIDGKQLLEPIYSISLKYGTKLLLYSKMKYGIFDINRQEITIPVKYKQVFFLNNKDKFSYLVTDSISIVNDKLCYFNCKLIDENNQAISDTIYNEVVLRDNKDTSYFLAKTTNGWNYYNLFGKKEFKVDYESIYLLNEYYYSNPCALVSKRNSVNELKYGVTTLLDSILTPLIYDKLDDNFEVFDMRDNYYYSHKIKIKNKILATNDSKFGIITTENKIVAPIIYTNITLIRQIPLAFVELENGKTGYLNYETGLKYFKD